MKFKMNDREWEIKEISKSNIIEIYEKETKQETLTVYGITKFENNTIIIKLKKQYLIYKMFIFAI